MRSLKINDVGMIELPQTRKQKISNFLHSIRFRLSLWFVIVLAVIMLIFSAFVVYRQVQAVHDQAAARVSARLSELDLVLRQSVHESGEGQFGPLPGASIDSTFRLQANEIVVLSNLNGAIVGSWGPVSVQTANQLAALSPNRSPDQVFTVDLPSSQDGATSPYVFMTVPSGIENHILGYATLGQPLDPDGQLPRLLLTLLIAGIATLLVALAGGYWLADRALRPVKAITRTAREIGETDLNRRLNIHTQDELGELAGTFDQMLDRLQAAFIRQRQFTADASHELRTPLTIIGLETGRALSSGRSSAEYQRTLEVIQSENEFMSGLVGKLLTLARMDSGQLELKLEKLDLSDLILDVLERYAPLAANKNIRLETCELVELPFWGDRQYLGLMVGNLVENAIKYSPATTDHWVRLEAGMRQMPAGPIAWIKVSDNGPGIPADHIPHLFDRFYRVDEARSHNPDEDDGDAEIPGSGLGLSIVQWIAEMHHGQINVQSDPGQGTTFEILLPVEPLPDKMPAAQV